MVGGTSTGAWTGSGSGSPSESVSSLGMFFFWRVKTEIGVNEEDISKGDMHPSRSSEGGEWTDLGGVGRKSGT